MFGSDDQNACLHKAVPKQGLSLVSLETPLLPSADSMQNSTWIFKAKDDLGVLFYLSRKLLTYVKVALC